MLCLEKKNSSLFFRTLVYNVGLHKEAGIFVANHRLNEFSSDKVDVYLLEGEKELFLSKGRVYSTGKNCAVSINNEHILRRYSGELTSIEIRSTLKSEKSARRN